MYHCICFICLGEKNVEIVLHKKEPENEILTQVKYLLPELTILDLRICSTCLKTLHSFYLFKKKCVDNYNRLINNAKIYNHEPVIKQEFQEESENAFVSSEDQDDDIRIVEHSIDIKEELITFEDDNEDLVVSSEEIAIENTIYIKKEFGAFDEQNEDIFMSSEDQDDQIFATKYTVEGKEEKEFYPHFVKYESYNMEAGGSSITNEDDNLLTCNTNILENPVLSENTKLHTGAITNCSQMNCEKSKKPNRTEISDKPLNKTSKMREKIGNNENISTEIQNFTPIVPYETSNTSHLENMIPNIEQRFHLETFQRNTDNAKSVNKDILTVTTEVTTKRRSNWFCNRPLSPIIVVPMNSEEPRLTSSEMCIPNMNTNSHEPELVESELIATNKCLDSPCSYEENIISSVETPHYDSDIDPDFLPDSEDDLLPDKKDALLPISETVTITLDDNSPIPKFNRADLKSKPIKKENYDVDIILKKSKRRRERDFCFFCDTQVLNFARHIFRKHSLETEVQRVLALPVRSKERKNSLSLLRKKGNFLMNSKNCKKPVKKPNLANITKYLPCEHCLGYYSSKQLWRHRKACISNFNNKPISQCQAQNYLLKRWSIDKNLREKVFPHMCPDEISLMAQKDSLICAFGARYLKIYKGKHFVNVTSIKMRQLGKLLIEVKKIEPAIKNLFTALQPKYFDYIVTATKIAATYDVNETSESPTFAMNIATSLKQCCEIAIIYALKKQDIYANIETSEAESDIKTLIQLLNSYWKFNISSQAANNLNMKKCNKITIVSLASDLKKLKFVLLQRATDAIEQLNLKNYDINGYNTLLETIFCRIILLNRSRPSELPKLYVKHYELSDQNGQHNYEEFGDTVSLPEKVLLQKFKRIIIPGKRGRGVPILLSIDIQDHIIVLLKYRLNFIDNANPFLFSRAHSLCGYKILKKYATHCGAENSAAITSTKLRKHLATLTQIFHMSENDIGQLVSFMGHTKEDHKKSYGLPDVYQTAKISKLLLLMEQGTAAEYKGRTLDEIDLNLEENLLDEKRDESDDDEEMNNENLNIDFMNAEKYYMNLNTCKITEATMTSNSNTNSKTCNITKTTIKPTSTLETSNLTESTVIPKHKRVLIPWTNEQKNIVNKYFEKYIKTKKPPKKRECDRLIQLFPDILKNKSWAKIKVYVQNKYTKKLK